jgi:hypothetical protein
MRVTFGSSDKKYRQQALWPAMRIVTEGMVKLSVEAVLSRERRISI